MKNSRKFVVALLSCALMAVGVTATSAEDNIAQPANLLCSIIGHDEHLYTAATGLIGGPLNDYCTYTYDLEIIECERCGEIIYEYEKITDGTPQPGTEPLYLNGVYVGVKCIACNMPMLP